VPDKLARFRSAPQKGFQCGTVPFFHRADVDAKKSFHRCNVAVLKTSGHLVSFRIQNWNCQFNPEKESFTQTLIKGAKL
jgi:hypothetical protein